MRSKSLLCAFILGFSTWSAFADNPVQISGVYPHLTTYAHHDPQGVCKIGSECGIDAEMNTPSDPYFMTGCDRKTLSLAAGQDTLIAFEIDIDHQSGWMFTNRSRSKRANRWTACSRRHLVRIE